jgi:hypothetical protein
MAEREFTNEKKKERGKKGKGERILIMVKRRYICSTTNANKVNEDTIYV